MLCNFVSILASISDDRALERSREDGSNELSCEFLASVRTFFSVRTFRTAKKIVSGF